MKLFWAILLAVFVAAGILLFRHGSGAVAPTPVEAPTSLAIEKPQSSAAPQQKFADAPAPATTAAAPKAVETKPAAPVSAAKPVASIDDLNSLLNLPPAPKEEAPAVKPAATAAALPTPTPVPAAAVPAPPAQRPAAAETTATTSAPAATGATAATGGAAGDIASKFKEIVPVRKAPGEDGWTTLDERFQIKGAGTAEDPYEVSWELLVSASETYQPRMGKLRMPERITMLDGKFVRITGYVAFPIMAMEQNEMLSMRNMWDGCCIGTPPTPYDAIEVKLKKAATGRDRFASYGSIYGKFSVDPYVKGNWLLGLYLMNDAELGPGKQGGL